MKKQFSTTYVCGDEKDQLTLETFQGTLHPGKPFSVSGGKKILLAGGFAALSPESPQPLSPTLQLQTDLTNLSQKQLLSVVKAEIGRQQRMHYHNYQVDGDPRVCVVGNKAQDLDSFVDTYGGVLEIHAILLGSESADYPVVSEVTVEQASQGCRIVYRKRSPLNQLACTYCRSCAAVCPQNCILPHLHIDFSSCTFCRECEKVCDTNALDIHGVEEVTLTVPAVILLEGARPEIAEDVQWLYHYNQLENYFKTLFSADITEVVCHNDIICQYSGRLGIGCGRCVDSCPHGAVSKNGSGIVVDHMLCEECGSCVAACPTGAMQNSSFSDESLVHYLNTLDIDKGFDLVLGEEEELHRLWWGMAEQKVDNRFFLEYTPLRFLSFFHFLLFLAYGFRRVIILGNEDLRNAPTLRRHIQKANRISRALFACDCVSLGDSSGMNTDAEDFPSPPSARAFTLLPTQSRRAMLSAVVEYLLGVAGKVIEDEGLAEDFHKISCDSERCTQCLACLNECKTGALQAEEEMSLSHGAGLCVGCAVCVSVCPENALALTEVGEISPQFFSRQVLAQAEPATCRRCGNIFGTRKSLDRVLSILSARETVDRDHFEYCSDCRVVKLFEAQ